MSKSIRSILLLGVILLLKVAASAQNLNQQQVQVIADKLLISKNYKATIKKILPSINDIQVVLLDMPYREFPSIIIIARDKTSQQWNRVFECLSPGIQDKPSGLLDWHTKGQGVDFEIDKTTTYDFANDKVKAIVESAFQQKGVVVIPYQNFIHMNTSSEKAKREFDPYTIDKTNYFDLANALFDDRYKNYENNNCQMFDTPAITDCTFTYANNLYTIKATTNNKQVWTYTFEGVDAQNRYLLNKKIKVN